MKKKELIAMLSVFAYFEKVIHGKPETHFQNNYAPRIKDVTLNFQAQNSLTGRLILEQLYFLLCGKVWIPNGYNTGAEVGSQSNWGHEETQCITMVAWAYSHYLDSDEPNLWNTDWWNQYGGGSGGGTGDYNPYGAPYVCNYVMTQDEKDAFNQLDREDQEANIKTNLDCQGTKRTGNIFFKGTKEHWMIQLDYVATNPVYGEAEFAIPNASIFNPSNRGYADIVNTANGNIFEIKPDNPAGIASGETEVDNYVNRANLYCTNTLPSGVAWNKGVSYNNNQKKYIPTGTSNRYLTARLAANGVIAYTYENISIPTPAPVAVPADIMEKFKHLVDRLRNNISNADRIISEYMRQNPDLLNYIKGAAIGVGVAIVVGTILEDILTAGVGIADDWASFVLAYRIVRFAVLL